jgi:PRTRC genetic system protein C
MKIEPIVREFIWKGTKLPDPNPAGSIESVRDTLTHTHPEIANGAIDGPKITGATHSYTFVASVGVKG